MWQRILYLRVRCFSAASGLAIIRDLSNEQHKLPEDDKQCAIENCRGLLSVLV
jgi:hypothetical protein